MEGTVKRVIRIKRPTTSPEVGLKDAVKAPSPAKKPTVAKNKSTPTPKKPSRESLLLLEGKKFYSFVLPIDLMNGWCEMVAATGKTPNERLLEIITEESKNAESN